MFFKCFSFGNVYFVELVLHDNKKKRMIKKIKYFIVNPYNLF